MFSKVTAIGGAMIVTAILATVVFQIREGFGNDDTERSVLVRSKPPGGINANQPAPINRYAEPRTLSDGAAGESAGETAPSASSTLSDSPSRYGQAAPQATAPAPQNPAPRNTAPQNSAMRTAPPRDAAPQGDSAPRTASRSALVGRLQQPAGVVPNMETSGQSAAGSSAGGEVVPYRRPGGLRNRTTTAAPPLESVAPPVEIQNETIDTSRRPAPINASSSSDISPNAIPSRVPAGRMPGNRAVATPPPASGTLMRSASPMVIVDAVGPQAIQIGKPATYVVRAANAGAQPAEQIMVRLQLPAAAKILDVQPTIGESQVIDNGDGTMRIDWQIDEMASQGQEQLEIAIVAQERAPVSLKMEWAMRPRQSITQIEVQEPQLDVHVVGPRAVMFGQTEVYTVTVSNPGTGAAENVVLDVALGGGPSESKRLGVIQPGGREVIKLELTAGDAGEMPILAAVRGDGGLSHEFEHRVVVRRAKLDIAVNGPQLKYAGSAASYTVTIRNTGDAPADAVEALVQLPLGAKYLGGLQGAEQKLQKLGWRVGALQPGDERTFRVRCDLTTAGDNRFNAVTSSSDQQQASTVFVTRVEAIADLKLIVNDPQGPQAVGDEVEYEITVLNRGSKAAQNVNVIAHFGKSVDPTGAEGLGYELTDDGQVVFRAIPRVAPGQSIVLKVRAKANNGGDHLFRAEVQCDEPNTQLSAEETTRYFGDRAASTARR